MSFIAKNPLTMPKTDNTPDVPNGTRGLVAKEDGWYDVDPNKKTKRIATIDDINGDSSSSMIHIILNGRDIDDIYKDYTTSGIYFFTIEDGDVFSVHTLKVWWYFERLYQELDGEMIRIFEYDEWSKWETFNVYLTPSEKNKLNALPTNEKLTEELSSKVPIIRIDDSEGDIISDASGLLDHIITEGTYIIIQETAEYIEQWVLHVTYALEYGTFTQRLIDSSGMLWSRCNTGNNWDSWYLASVPLSTSNRDKLNTLPTNEELTEELKNKVRIDYIDISSVDGYDYDAILNQYQHSGVYILVFHDGGAQFTEMLCVERDFDYVIQTIHRASGSITQRSFNSEDDSEDFDVKTLAVPLTPDQKSKLNALPTNEELTAELSSKVPTIIINDLNNEMLNDDVLDHITDAGVYNIIQKTDMEEKSWMLFVEKYEDYEVYQHLVTPEGYVYYRLCVYDVWESWQLVAASFHTTQRDKLNALPTNAQLNKKFADEQAYMQDYVANELATFDFIKVVDTLPEEGLANRIYFVPKADAENQDLFDEYAWVNGEWEWITTKQMEIDLTSYVQKSAFTYDSETKTLIIDM